MSNIIYVYSTLSNDQAYDLKDGRTVVIYGKANVADKRLMTPKGKVTKVTEDEFILLQENIVFKAHAKNGFLTGSYDEMNTERFVEANLEPADKSAQASPTTLAKVPGAAITTATKATKAPKAGE